MPIGARDDNKTVPAGNGLSPVFSAPSFVIVRSVSVISKSYSLISAGVTHFKYPFQNYSRLLLGVEPVTISQTSPNFTFIIVHPH